MCIMHTCIYPNTIFLNFLIFFYDANLEISFCYYEYTVWICDTQVIIIKRNITDSAAMSLVLCHALLLILLCPQSADSSWSTRGRLQLPRTIFVNGGGRNIKNERSSAEPSNISNKMKYILENELMYTLEEVGRMDPEVARIVVEKKLTRPLRGMPPSWNRATAGKKKLLINRAITSAAVIWDDLTALMDVSSCKDSLIYVASSATALYALKYILWSSILGLLLQKENARGSTYPRDITLPQIKRTKDNVGAFREDVDMSYLDIVRKRSTLDKLRAAVDIIKDLIT